MAENKAPKSATKSEILQTLSEKTGLSRKQVASVFDALLELTGQQMGKKGPGVFTIPGMVKLKRVHKPATKAREGINPFTKQPQMFKAKPARTVIKPVALKGLKDMVK
jgi:nucleoid DNA-binding protein